MDFKLLHEVINLVEEFQNNKPEGAQGQDINDFVKWVSIKNPTDKIVDEPVWEGKLNGRSPESVISTLLVHMNRYAKSYSKSAIINSSFSTQEEFIFLINLKAFGSMTKMSLIKMNKQEKPAGMQTINRLINMGWIKQEDSPTDKRSKVLTITSEGENALEMQMDKIRQASKIVCADLSESEKMELIRLLNKLDAFHQVIYDQNIPSEELLQQAYQQYLNKQK